MRSAAKTPNWQVKLESTRTIVFVSENGKFSSDVSAAHRSGAIDRRVK